MITLFMNLKPATFPTVCAPIRATASFSVWLHYSSFSSALLPMVFPGNDGIQGERIPEYGIASSIQKISWSHHGAVHYIPSLDLVHHFDDEAIASVFVWLYYSSLSSVISDMIQGEQVPKNGFVSSSFLASLCFVPVRPTHDSTRISLFWWMTQWLDFDSFP